MFIVDELNVQLTALEALAILGSVASSHQPVCTSVVTAWYVVKADRNQSHNAVFLPTHYHICLDYGLEHPQDLSDRRSCTYHFCGKMVNN